MRIITSDHELLNIHGCVLVPTMGALHQGHLALVGKAREVRDRLPGKPPVVVWIFVNPTQFNDPGDLQRYPRTLQADADGCARAGADLVFTPTEKTVYPPGVGVRTPDLPLVATAPGLEDAKRPGHFAGVCQVVLRMFEMLRPAAAVFGEKDWQQLAVVRAMVDCEKLGVHLVGFPTVREPDGLAMSSRNVFLKPADRPRAAAVHRALVEGGRATSPRQAEELMRQVLVDSGLSVEYACVRNATTLMSVALVSPNVKCRALIAAGLSGIRLIDNAPWPTPTSR